MRYVALVFALLVGGALTFIAARYGYTLTDNHTDALIWGFLYGAITLGGLFGHGFALRVWRHNKGAGAFIFAVAMAALIISLSNSLGSMASRGNETMAKRQGVADAVKDARRDLESAQNERDKLSFKPTDQAAVDAAKVKAEAATKARVTECQGYQGNACRKKQEIETKALSELSALSQEKTATDRARELDAKIKALTEKIRAAGPVLETNSQGSALARLLGFAQKEAAKLLTWQNLGMGTVVELMIVAAIIGYEVLTHAHHEAQSRTPVPQAPITAERAVPARARELHPIRDEPEELEPDEIQPLLERPKPVRQITFQREPFGNVIDIIVKVMAPAAGGRVEIKEAYFAYAHACKGQGKKPFPPDKFATEIKRFCKEARVKIHAEEHGVYLLNVRLKASEERELEGEAS